MKTYKITFDNGQIRTLTILQEGATPEGEIEKSKPLDGEIENSEILSIEELA